MFLDEYQIYTPRRKNAVEELNPLAIFSLVRKIPSAQTCMTICRASDGQTLDIDFLAGMPKNREYNLIQGSDGKQGLIGIEGVGSDVTLDEGLFTVTSDGSANYVNMQWKPLIFNSEGRRIFFRSRSRLISGNIPRHIFLHFDTLTAGRTTYELPVNTNIDDYGKWFDFTGIVNMGTSHFIDGDVSGSAFDNRIISRVLVEVEYEHQTDAINTVWQLDGRVDNINQNAAVVLDMGTSNINPLYNMTVEEINAAFPTFVKAFGYESGEIDASSIISFCENTTGYVKNWKDQTGNGYTGIQDTVTNMPIICNYNTMYPNVVFYGVNDFLRTNGAILNGQSEYTITTKHMAGLGGNFSSDNVYRFIFSQGDISKFTINATTNKMEFGVNNQYYARSIPHLFEDISTTMQKTDSEIKLYTNGQLVDSNPTIPITITDTSNTYIGTDGSRFFYGLLFELCFYGSKPSTRIASALSQNASVNDSSSVNKVNTVSDKVTGAICSYGLVKLHPDAKRCLKVQRQSDKSIIDVEFLGKYMDIKSVTDFAGYSSLEITTVYNQPSEEFNLYNNEKETLNILPTSIVTSSDVNVTSDNVNDIFVTNEIVSGYGILAADDDSTIQFKGVITGNGVYSYEFWCKCADEEFISVNVNDRNSKLYCVNHDKWKHCKMETFTVDNYSAGINDYLEIVTVGGKFLQVYGLKVCKNRRISNRPLLVDNGTLKTGVAMDIEQYMWTAQKHCRGRYVREYLRRGSDVSTTSHWVEIAVYKGVIDVAIGKPVSCNFEIANGILDYVTNGNIMDGKFVGAVADSVDPYVQIDLGEIVDIDNIVTWHTRTLNRTYKGVLVQVSEDEQEWTTVYDSDVDGERMETEEGNIIFDRKLHCLDSFSVYTGFTTDFYRSEIFARIVAKGAPGVGGSMPVQSGWSISRLNNTTTGDFRIDTNSDQNMLARLSNVWDTGHSLFYEWDNDANTLLVYKDWVVMTAVSGIYGATTLGGGYVGYPKVGTHTINTPLPLIVGGYKNSTVGSIKTVMIFDHVLSEEEILSLRNCAL